MSSANVYFVEFEQVNIYLRKFNVWSLKLFDSFILIHYDCVRGMVTSFIRYLSRFGFSFFKLKWKTKNKLQIWISMFSYFENRKTSYFDVFCLNSSLETKIKTLFVISYFNLSKKGNGTLGTRIIILLIFNMIILYSKFINYYLCLLYANVSCW